MDRAAWLSARLGSPTANGCREWLRTRNAQGYGIGYPAGRKTRAHRFAWEVAYGPIPIGLWVLHRCDNPPCCELSHLFLGTAQDNVNDMLDKGRWTPITGSDHWARRNPDRVKRGTASAKYGMGLRRTHCKAGHSLADPNGFHIPPTGRYGPRIGCRKCKRLAYLRRKSGG